MPSIQDEKQVQRTRAAYAQRKGSGFSIVPTTHDRKHRRDRDLLAGHGVAALTLLLRRLDTNIQLHQPANPYLLGVGELFEHDLIKRGERSLRLGMLSSGRSATALASWV